MKSLSHVRPSATPWTAAFQAPPSMGFSRQEYWSGCHGLLRIILLRSPKLSLLFNHFDWRVIFQWDYLLSCSWALGVFPSLCLVTNVATIFLKSVSFLNECIHWLDCKRLRNDETVEASTSLSQRSKRDHGATFFPTFHLIGCLNFCQSSWCTKIFHCDFDLKYPCIYFYQKQSEKLAMFATSIMTATD